MSSSNPHLLGSLKKTVTQHLKRSSRGSDIQIGHIIDGSINRMKHSWLAYARIRRQGIFVSRKGHHVRLSNHSGKNPCFVLVLQHCRYDPNQSSLTALRVRRSSGNWDGARQKEMAWKKQYETETMPTAVKHQRRKRRTDEEEENVDCGSWSTVCDASSLWHKYCVPNPNSVLYTGSNRAKIGLNLCSIA